jgi:alanyl-tRNA synthetase
MNSDESYLENKFLSFSKRKNFSVVNGSSIVSLNDPSTLYVTAGIQLAKDQVLDNFSHQDLASSQWCLRMNSLDQVGNTQKLTAFKMLTSLTFGNATRYEHFCRFFDFCDGVLGLSIDQLSFNASTALGNQFSDEDSVKALSDIGIPSNRIFSSPRKWSQPFRNGPTGPNLFIRYAGSPASPPVHFWNLEFLEFLPSQNTFVRSPSPILDCAGNLETALAASLGTWDVFKQGSLAEILAIVSAQGFTFDLVQSKKISDHLRTAGLCIAAGVEPASKAHGSVLRRLIVRVLEELWLKGLDLHVLESWLTSAIGVWGSGDMYLGSVVGRSEVDRFESALRCGRNKFDFAIKKFIRSGGSLEDLTHRVQSSSGVPFSVIVHWLSEVGLELDIGVFNGLRETHIQKSKKMFNG